MFGRSLLVVFLPRLVFSTRVGEFFRIDAFGAVEPLALGIT